MKTILTAANTKTLRDPLPAGNDVTRSQSPTPAQRPDEYVDRLTKLIPVEVTAAFTALVTGAAAAGAYVQYAPVVALGLGVVFSIVHLRHDGRSTGIMPLRRQYVLSVAAFMAWAASIRDPLAAWDLQTPPWMLFFAMVSIPTLGAWMFPPTNPTGR